MEFNTIFNWFLILSNYLVIGLHLRSIFYLYTVKNKISLVYILGLLIPLTASMVYCLLNSNNIVTLHERFPLAWLGAMGLSVVSYIVTKILYEGTHTIEKVLNEEVGDNLPEDVATRISSNRHKLEIIPLQVILNDILINKTEKVNKKVAIRWIDNAVEDENSYTIMGYYLKDGMTGIQIHPDADEQITVMKGTFLELYSGKIVKQGARLNYPAGSPHGFIALEYGELRGFFTPKNKK